jgi:GT2 family glycosyltransferase
MNSVDIIVLNYNGAEIIPLCLPSIVEAAKRSPVPCNVIILDNKSTDNSLQFIRQNFPEIKIIISEKNEVLFSYNKLLPKLGSDVVILLNNDVRVDPNFVAPLLEHFEDDSVFAVAPKQKNFEGYYCGGKNYLYFVLGVFKTNVFEHTIDIHPNMERTGNTLFEANAAYDRKKLITLGCFDPIYFPYTWEDTDLGFRAWKAGYKFIYEPKSSIKHYECFSFKNANKGMGVRRVITRRNSFIFTWKNINDPYFLTTHFLLLPLNIIYWLFYDRPRISALLKAIILLPEIIKKRIAQKKTYRISDRNVLREAKR